MLDAISVVRANDYREMPWRNGRGVTEEIFVDPAPGDAGAGFAWRLSRALIAAGGPFSAFPGCDRTLVLLDAAELDLVLPGRTVRLAECFARADFSGDDPVEAGLPGGGPVRVLNVIVDRARARAEVALLRVGPAPLALPPAPLVAIHAAGGSLVLARGAAEETVTIDPGDSLFDRNGRPAWLRSAAGQPDAAALVVTASRVLPNS